MDSLAFAGERLEFPGRQLMSAVAAARIVQGADSTGFYKRLILRIGYVLTQSQAFWHQATARTPTPAPVSVRLHGACTHGGVEYQHSRSRAGCRCRGMGSFHLSGTLEIISLLPSFIPPLDHWLQRPRPRPRGRGMNRTPMKQKCVCAVQTLTRSDVSLLPVFDPIIVFGNAGRPEPN